MMESPFLRRRAIPVQHNQTKPSPKVVSIPVHFIGSERNRSNSAVKIQKVFRGFLVRKSVKTIAAISSEVEDIEKRISKKESIELIRSNSKERLKINEILMRLLFRLDSVRGVDSGVRNYRKKVIKKAIALQEMVDTIVTDDNYVVEDKKVIVENDNIVREEESESLFVNDTEIQEPEKKEEGCVGKEENERNREKVLERIMEEDNERMMGLMAKLVESNEMQTRLISSLSHRVEELERAFVCEKLRRKKQRHACGNGDCFQT